MNNLAEQIAKMFCVGFHGQAPSEDLKGLVEMGVRNVIVFGRNIERPEQVFELTAAVKGLSSEPVMICIDQEGGRVRRLQEGFTKIPAMRLVGHTKDPMLARHVGVVLGKELRSVNVDVDFAPCMDVDTNPANPVIAARSFGADPHLVGRLGCEVIVGLQAHGVVACAKHFPGHGDTHLDSHKDLPILEHSIQRLETVELPPFKAAVDAGVASIMSAHVIMKPLDEKYPATLSANVLDGILRKRFGFDGVIYTDDFEMKAIADHYGFEESIVMGIRAGCDVILICHTPEQQRKGIETAIKAVERGEIPRQRIEESNKRIDRLIHKYFHPAGKKYVPVAPDNKLVEEIERRCPGMNSEGKDPTNYK